MADAGAVDVLEDDNFARWARFRAIRKPVIRPAVVMFSSLLVERFIALMSSVESALRSRNLSLYFSSG